jgi:hypothetical protein
MSVRKFQLPCCALCQLTANDDDSIRHITRALDILKAEAKYHWTPGNRDSGERAAFVIVAPGEDRLEKNLKTLKFEKVYEFSRRNGYAEGTLKMYVTKW